MNKFKSRKAFSHQYLATLTVALQVAQEAVQSVPIAGNALSGPVGVVLKILDIVDVSTTCTLTNLSKFRILFAERTM